jgi:hypothetical protein
MELFMANSKKKPTKTTKKTTKPVKKETALVKQETTFIPADDFGGFLTEQDELVAHYLSKGYSDKEVREKFGVTAKYLEDLRKNPTFVKFYQTKVMSTGMANKTNRIAAAKRSMEQIADTFFKKVEEGDLDKQNTTTLWRMMNEADVLIGRLMGEDKVSEQNINVLIKTEIAQRTNKVIENFDEYNPSDDFKVIDVSYTEVKKDEQ